MHQVAESARGGNNSEKKRNLCTCLQQIAYTRFKIYGEGDDHILCNGEAWWSLNVAVERINEFYAGYNGQFEVNDKEMSVAALRINYICKCFVITVCECFTHAGRLCSIHFPLNFLQEIANKNNCSSRDAYEDRVEYRLVTAYKTKLHLFTTINNGLMYTEMDDEEHHCGTVLKHSNNYCDQLWYNNNDNGNDNNKKSMEVYEQNGVVEKQVDKKTKLLLNLAILLLLLFAHHYNENGVVHMYDWLAIPGHNGLVAIIDCFMRIWLTCRCDVELFSVINSSIFSL